MKRLLSTTFAASLLWLGVFSGEAKANAYDRVFARADINNSDSLSMDEFMSTQVGAARWTDAAHRFNANDLDRNGSLSELEFRGSRGGRDGGRPNKQETFQLADTDDNGSLDPTEFALTLPQNWDARKVSRTFDLRDRDDSSLISRREFGLLGLPV